MDRQLNTKALEDVLQKYEIEVSMNQSNVEIKINPEQLIEVATALKSNLSFELLMDVIAVDYLTYGDVDWKTNNATSTGYSRQLNQQLFLKLTRHLKADLLFFINCSRFQIIKD
jgi:NADH:ubiquinone oxidoreductase subunit C